MLNAVVILD